MNHAATATTAGTPDLPLSRRRQLLGLLVLLALVGVLGGVLVSQLDFRLRVKKPAGFAEVEQPSSGRSGPFVQKLIAPDGTVIAVRRFDNPDVKTGLDYWGQALEIEKTQKDGMLLVAREELTTSSGQQGMLFDFEVGEPPSHIRYLIGLFVIGDSIYTVEAGGRPDSITASRETIVSTMKTLGE